MEQRLSTATPVGGSAFHDDDSWRTAYRWRLIRSLLLGQVSTGASLTIIALATAEISADLNTSPTVVAWSVTGGVLGSAIGGALGGKLGDIHGHRRIYRVALFAVAVLTALSAVAWSGPSFLIIRVLAGVAAGATSANSTAMVLHAFPVSERTKAMGLYQSALTLAPALGLLLGGPMIDHLGWRAMFWVFTALVTAGYIWAYVVVEERGQRMARRIDYLGAITLSASVVSVLLFFDRAKAFGISDPVPMLTLACAAVSIVLFVVIESRVAEPLLRLDYFRRRNFVVPTVVGAGYNYAFMGGLVVTPLLMHRVFGYSNTAAASVLFLRPMGYSVTAAFAGRLHGRFGTRSTAIAGGVIVVASMVLFAVGSEREQIGIIIVGLVLAGLGLGIATPGLVVASANASDPQDFGVSTGMRTTITQVGVTAGIQSMTIALGTSYTPSAFAGSFWLGCTVAAAATLLALTIRDTA
jgi:MFS family permease